MNEAAQRHADEAVQLVAYALTLDEWQPLQTTYLRAIACALLALVEIEIEDAKT